MTREVTKEEAIAHFKYGISHDIFSEPVKSYAKMAIEALQERPKGRWAHLGGDEWCCTNCGYVISTEGSWEKPDAKFCEECGADMRESE